MGAANTITKNVPVLRPDYATSQGVLPGMRQVSQGSLKFDPRRERNGRPLTPANSTQSAALSTAYGNRVRAEALILHFPYISSSAIVIFSTSAISLFGSSSFAAARPQFLPVLLTTLIGRGILKTVPSNIAEFRVQIEHQSDGTKFYCTLGTIAAVF